MPVFRAEVKATVDLVRQLGLQPEELNEAVHDAASTAASDANNQGLQAQVELMVEIWGPLETREFLREYTQGKREAAGLQE